MPGKARGRMTINKILLKMNYETLKTLKNAVKSVLILVLLISVNSCKTGLKINPKECPSWLRDPAKSFNDLDLESLSDSGVNYLYDLQQEHDIRCKK